jgi:hypothetical protein
MRDRRISTRQKSFLQGRIYFNNRRVSVDCLVRDVSDKGAKLVFSDVVTVPDIMELYLSNKEEVRRAKVQWRHGSEVGVAFNFDEPAGTDSMEASSDLFGRVLRLESECAQLRRSLKDVRQEMRKMRAAEEV